MISPRFAGVGLFLRLKLQFLTRSPTPLSALFSFRDQTAPTGHRFQQ